MTKKDLLEAIEDMSMDVPIMKVIIDKGVFITPITSIEMMGQLIGLQYANRKRLLRL